MITAVSNVSFPFSGGAVNDCTRTVHIKNYKNWNQELWEGEKIYYKCSNTSLVIDNTKGMEQKEYMCQITGDYDTPNNMGVLWPECTEPPVDPSKPS